MPNESLNDWRNLGFKHMESMIDDAMVRFRELSTMINQMSTWNEIHENSLDRFYEMTRIANTFNPMIFFIPSSNPFKQDFKNNYDTFLKLMGLISIDEYQSLIKKYEEIKRQSHELEKTNNEQIKRITELNQIASSEKKKASSQNKSADATKAELEEQKKTASILTKELENLKKHALSLEKEIDSLKKQLAEKNQTSKKNEKSNT